MWISVLTTRDLCHKSEQNAVKKLYQTFGAVYRPVPEGMSYILLADQKYKKALELKDMKNHLNDPL